MRARIELTDDGGEGSNDIPGISSLDILDNGWVRLVFPEEEGKKKLILFPPWRVLRIEVLDPEEE